MTDSTKPPENDNPVDFFGVEPGQTSDAFLREHANPKSLEKLWYSKGYAAGSNDSALLEKTVDLQMRQLRYYRAQIVDLEITVRALSKSGERINKRKARAADFGRPDKPYYIYIIKHPEGYFKIGISHDPAKRARKLTANAKHSDPTFEGEFKVMCTHKVMGRTLAYKVEQQAHHGLKFFHMSGEWFRFPIGSLHLVRNFIWKLIEDNGSEVDMNSDGYYRFSEWFRIIENGDENGTSNQKA